MFGCSDGSKCLVALQSHNKRFVSAEENGKANANSEKYQNSEVFEVTFHGPNKVNLKGYHKKYLYSKSDGTVNADGTNTNYIGYYWTVEYKGKDGFAFKSYLGKYLVAETNGVLNANGNNAGLWESFKVIKVKGRPNKIKLLMDLIFGCIFKAIKIKVQAVLCLLFFEIVEK